ncbi:MAG: OsmC family protein [Pirellulales bacterium]|nr:OsmC family protein [Pirellulales bacterium]
MIILRGPGKTILSPPPDFGGKEDALSPEEMFVGAINGCLMLTFLYFAEKVNIEIVSYHSEAKGEVKKGNEGYAFAKVDVKAKIAVSNDRYIENTREISHLAKQYCLVSNSVICPVSYEAEVIGIAGHSTSRCNNIKRSS